MAPLRCVSIKTAAYQQEEVLDAAKTFVKTEGIVPAPETAHAIKQTIVEALKCKRRNLKKTIVFCFSGHGLLDLGAYGHQTKLKRVKSSGRQGHLSSVSS